MFRDPLHLLALMLGVAACIVIVGPTFTGRPPDIALLAGTSTILGVVLSAIGNRRSKEKDGDDKP